VVGKEQLEQQQVMLVGQPASAAAAEVVALKPLDPLMQPGVQGGVLLLCLW
jgi:hypothetical protein